MALEGENELYTIGEKIKAAAVERGLDLNDPDNEHTVWCDLNGRMQYSGSFAADSHAAWSNGRQHPSGYKVYVAKGPLHGFGIMEVEAGGPSVRTTTK
jgi:hypothetical protein